MDNKRLKLGSLFSGSGGFELAGCLNGIEPVWSSEIEPFPLRVEAARFPKCKQLGSVTDINGAEVEPVDIVTWGSPCQDLSVAGKQAGLTGARSGLYVEAVRIIKEMYDATNGEYPKFGVFENVPGLLSSNKGNDFIAAMDMMQDIGFLPDPNIIDAQYFGVPQRRKRVYIAWMNVNYILNQRTDLSRNITLQLLTELLQSNLADLLRALGNAQKELDALPRKLSADGARKRIKLFSLQKEENLLTLQKNLDAIQAIYQKERGNWESKIGEDQTEPITLITMAMPLNPLTMEFQDGYIGQLLKQALDDRCEMEKSSIISTLTNSTIAEKISFYFQALANTSNVIGVYINFLAKTNPHKLTHCEWVKSFLTEMKVFINAANRHEKSVGHVGWDDDVRFCERAVSACTKYLIADFGSERAGEILSFSEGLRGDSSESGETREGTAADVEGSAGRSDSVKCLNPWDAQSIRQFDANGCWPSLQAYSNGGQNRSGVCYAVEGNTVDRTSNKNGKGYCEGVSPTLNTQDKHAVTYAIEGNGQRRSHQGDGYAETDKMYTLNTIERHAVVFEPKSALEENWSESKVKNALRAEASKSSHVVCYPNVARTLTERHDSSPCVDRGQNFICVQNTGRGWRNEGEVAETLRTPCGGDSTKANLVVSYGVDCRNAALDKEKTHTIQAKANGGISLNCTPSVLYDARGNGGGYDRSDHHGRSSKQSE